MKNLILFAFCLVTLVSCKKDSPNQNTIPTKVYVSRVTVTRFPNNAWDALSNADLYIKIGQGGSVFWTSNHYTDVPSIGYYTFDMPNIELNPNSDLTVWFYDYDPTTTDDLMVGINFDVQNDGTGGNNPHFTYIGYEWNLNVTYAY